jgi:hypothetical protein
MICKITCLSFCRNFEKIENYEKAMSDTTQVWHCHHRLETHNSDGERRFLDITSKELIALDMYYDRPPEEFIFLTESEHRKLHKPSKGKKFSEEQRKRVSESHKGQIPWNKGKSLPSHPGYTKGKHWELSDESKKRISESHKGKKLSENHKKHLSESHKGYHWKVINGKRVFYREEK